MFIFCLSISLKETVKCIVLNFNSTFSLMKNICYKLKIFLACRAVVRAILVSQGKIKKGC